MKIKRLLSACIVIAGTTTLLISWKAQNTVSSTYESRSTVEVERYYTNAIQEEIMTLETEPTYIVGERELVGLTVSKLNVEEKEEKEPEEKEPINRWDIELTKDEIDLLAKILWVEARGEIDKGQRAVVEVVLNRMKHWDFDDELYDILSHKKQFSSWKLRSSATPTDKEYDNIYEVLKGNTDITTMNTVYFSTKARNNKIVAHIGGHWFCEYEYDSIEDKE